MYYAAVFVQVKVDAFAEAIVWPNGADLDPDVLYGAAEPASGPAPRISTRIAPDVYQSVRDRRRRRRRLRLARTSPSETQSPATPCGRSESSALRSTKERTSEGLTANSGV